MDFFEHQDQARKNTKVLVVYFGIAVACIIASVYLASLLIFYGTHAAQPQPGAPPPELVLWDPKLFLYVVLSALANVSSRNAGEIEMAFRAGAPHLGAKADGLQLLSRAECGLEQLDTALDRLALAAPRIKENVIEACLQVVGADGLIQELEAELLRAIADTLDCPIPPFLEMAES